MADIDDKPTEPGSSGANEVPNNSREEFDSRMDEISAHPVSPLENADLGVVGDAFNFVAGIFKLFG